MNVLQLFFNDGPTSMPYNELCIGLRKNINQFIVILDSSISKKKYPSIKIFSSNGSVFKMIFNVRKIIQDNQIDVIHIHSGHMWFILFFALVPFNLNELKFTTFTFHTSWNLLSVRNKIFTLFAMLFSKKTVACSKSSFLCIPVSLKKIKKNKIQYIVNGYNDVFVNRVVKNSVKKNNYFENNNLKIISVGALNDNKNHEEVIRQLSKNKFLNAQFNIIGDGPNKTKLKYLAEEVNKDSSGLKIKIVGKLDREFVIEALAEADIFISLSKGEGMPLAVLEAMGAGCYTILSDIPSHKEVHPPNLTCSFLYEHSNLKNIIDDLISFGKEKINDGGQKAKSFVNQNFNLKKMLKEYEGIYYDLKNQRRRGES